MSHLWIKIRNKMITKNGRECNLSPRAILIPKTHMYKKEQRLKSHSDGSQTHSLGGPVSAACLKSAQDHNMWSCTHIACRLDEWLKAPSKKINIAYASDAIKFNWEISPNWPQYCVCSSLCFFCTCVFLVSGWLRWEITLPSILCYYLAVNFASQVGLWFIWVSFIALSYCYNYLNFLLLFFSPFSNSIRYRDPGLISI